MYIEDMIVRREFSVRWKSPVRSEVDEYVVSAGKRHAPRNTATATDLDKRKLAESLGLSLDAVCTYLSSRYIKAILNK